MSTINKDCDTCRHQKIEPGNPGYPWRYCDRTNHRPQKNVNMMSEVQRCDEAADDPNFCGPAGRYWEPLNKTHGEPTP